MNKRLCYMLDTNILIDLLRGHVPHLLQRLNNHLGELCVSSITTMELDYGVSKSQRPDKMRHDVDSLLDLCEVASFDREAGRHAGNVRAELAKTGQTIGPYDALIAGHARSLGLTVITHNLREFQRVTDLMYEDWLV